MLKAYKYRIYPNSEQRIQIAKTFGCCRFVYNQTLAYRKEIYEKEKKSVSKTDCNNYCNRELKKDYEWLKEIDKFALTNAIYHMDAAYQKFFKEHAGYPKFKSKHDNHKSYTTNFTNGNIAVDFETGKIKLPKLKAVKAKHDEYVKRLDTNDWRYFAEEELKDKESKIKDAKEMQEKTTNKLEIKEIQNQIRGLEISRQIASWRLEKDIPYGNDYKNDCLNNYRVAMQNIRDYEFGEIEQNYDAKKQYYEAKDSSNK